MIGATRATWGHVFRMTPIPRAREAHNGVLVAPRGPNSKNARFSALRYGRGGPRWGHVELAKSEKETWWTVTAGTFGRLRAVRSGRLAPEIGVL